MRSSRQPEFPGADVRLEVRARGTGFRKYMADELLTAADAARRLGIRVTTLYDWLGQSDHGLLRLRGAPLTIDYLQSGPQGQGKIALEASEVERIKQALRVVPQQLVPRRPITRPQTYPGINVVLGRPPNA